MNFSIWIDINFSPEWASYLANAGHRAIYWADVGDPRAADATIMAWASANGFVVLTRDLDFGTALALTHAQGPSVVQVRAYDVLPEHIGPFVLSLLRRYEAELASGALVVVEEGKSRIRVLPF